MNDDYCPCPHESHSLGGCGSVPKDARWVRAELEALVFKAHLTGDTQQVERILRCLTPPERAELALSLNRLAVQIGEMR